MCNKFNYLYNYFSSKLLLQIDVSHHYFTKRQKYMTNATMKLCFDSYEKFS